MRLLDLVYRARFSAGEALAYAMIAAGWFMYENPEVIAAFFIR